MPTSASLSRPVAGIGPYRAPVWLPGGNLQTIYAALFADAGASVPQEPHEQLWSGTLIPDSTGGYCLDASDGQRWPLITLEPALHHWLGLQEHPTPVALVGCQNHAGPWLRVSRLAG